MTAHDINNRYRLGAKSKDEDGIWFEFEKAKSEIDFENVAINVLKLLNLSDRNWVTSLCN